jgi:hypothetical protein
MDTPHLTNPFKDEKQFIWFVSIVLFYVAIGSVGMFLVLGIGYVLYLGAYLGILAVGIGSIIAWVNDMSLKQFATLTMKPLLAAIQLAKPSPISRDDNHAGEHIV